MSLFYLDQISILVIFILYGIMFSVGFYFISISIAFTSVFLFLKLKLVSNFQMMSQMMTNSRESYCWLLLLVMYYAVAQVS